MIRIFEKITQKWRQRKLKKYPYACGVCKKLFRNYEMEFNEETNTYLPNDQCCKYQAIQLHAFTPLIKDVNADCEIIYVNSPFAKDQREHYHLTYTSWEFIVKYLGLDWNEKRIEG